MHSLETTRGTDKINEHQFDEGYALFHNHPDERVWKNWL